MLTFIIVIAASCAIASAFYFAAGIGLGWCIAWGIVSFIAMQIATSFFFRKKMMVNMDVVQRILLEGQKNIQAKVQRWQIRPPGSIQTAQAEIMRDTKTFVSVALERTETLRRYKLWVPMIDRQIATAKLQLCWMIRDYKQVDALLPKVIFADPTLLAMKLARMQMLNAPIEDIRKAYEKGTRRLRYNQNVLLAATFSWIQVKRGDADGAFKTLTDALKNSDNETLKKNHEHLMNNKISHFSNAGIGDQWYALNLEEPKIRMQRPRQVYR